MDVKDEFAALNLGTQIRQLRNQRGFTLQNVADMTGLSKPLLSQIENNIASPPIATLIKISKALGVKIGHFFKESDKNEKIVVVRKDDKYVINKRHPHQAAEIGYFYKPLAYPLVDKQMEPFIVDMQEMEDDKLVYNNHAGEEFIYVINGTLEFKSSGKTIVLEEGDSLYFDSVIPHAFRGLNAPAKIIAILYTPK